MKDIDKLELSKHIELSEGAYFFKKGDIKITKKKVEKIFNDVLNNIEYKIYTRIYRKKQVLDNSDIYYSLLIYKYQSNKISFLDFEDVPNELKESKLAYLLIVEIKSHIIIVKKNISNISSFINDLTSIPAETLAGVLIDDKTIFQHIKLSNMNMNENAIRNKSYEANSLESTMPMFGANHTVVNTARFKNIDGLCAVNICTSRLSKFGTKKGLLDLLKWMNALTLKLETYTYKTSFFSRFAKPQSWNNIQAKLEPTSLLIDIFKLHSYIQALECNDIFIKKNNGEHVPVTNYFSELIGHGIKCIYLENKNGELYTPKKQLGLGAKKTKLGIKVVACGCLFKSLYYYENNKPEPEKIVDLINKIGCYSVGFSSYSYIYMNKQLYMNANIQDDFNSILSVLCPKEDIDNVVSEKGDDYNGESREFDKNSMFGIIENSIFKDVKFLLCDDLGNEWADHIAIDENKISYIHSKCNNEKKPTLSASKFQEVIGQAIKNIGNINPDEKAIQDKINSMYGNWNKTGIKKCRKGDPALFNSLYNQLRHNPNKTQEVCLAVNFLSYQDLDKAFDKIRNNQPLKEKKWVIQLAWLLSGFISTCKEADLNCRIFCHT